MTDPALTRRGVLAAGAAGAAGLALPALAEAGRRRSRRAPLATEGAFTHGVASGAASAGSLLLWTRLDGVDRTVRIGLEVARDRDFRRVVHRTTIPVRAAQDWIVQAPVPTRGLPPGEPVFYRFFTRERTSTVGRTLTARAPDTREPVRIGFGSCQDWRAGLYSAHGALAAEELDLFVHLGDYTYEGGGGPAFPSSRPPDRSGPNHDGDVQTQAEYREKLRHYRTDPDLQALHAAHPVLAVWDDHDVEVDWAGETAGRSAPRRVPYEVRRLGALRAFHEYLPRFRPRSEPERVYGRVPLGANADVLLMDLRSYRTPLPCPDRRPSFSGAGVRCADYDRPTNTMLGDTQRRWLLDRLAAPGGTWRLLGSSVMMMGWDLPTGNALIGENWDGAAGERARIVEQVRAAGRDAVVLSGDAHGFFSGTVTSDGRITGRPGLTEFLGGALASDPAVAATAGEQEKAAFRAVTNGFYASNPHWSFLNFVEAGYGIVEARPDELRATFKAVRTRARRDPATRVLAEFVVARGEPGARRRAPAGPVEPAEPPPGAPPVSLPPELPADASTVPGRLGL